MSKDMEEKRKCLLDSECSLEEKLEIFQEIIDSEVGDTTLLRARNIEREVEFRQIYLKFEGGNPSGTQKDRIAFNQVMDALRRGFDAITVATCGNYGNAIALASFIAGIRCVIFIPSTYHTEKILDMESMGAEIRRVDGDYEKALAVSSEFAGKEEIYDANPGGDNTTMQLQSYGQIAYEIYDELRDAPWAVAAPVSNGTTLAGIYKGFVSLYRRGKTSRLPHIVAGSSFGKNPIIKAFQSKSERCDNIDPNHIRETRINEPLINWQSVDGDLVLEGIRQTDGWADHASDKKMLSFTRLIREKEGLNVIPASTAGLIALVEKNNRMPMPNDRFVAVLTGRR